MKYLSFLLFLVVSIFTTFLITYVKMHKFIVQIINKENSRVPIKSNTLNGERFKVITKDGLELVGNINRLDMNPKGIIVCSHNLGGRKEGLNKHVKFLCNAGYIVVNYDFRNHGESQKDRKLRFNLCDDIEAIIKYVEKINIANLPIGLFGLSMGCVASLLYASKKKDISAIILDGGPLLYKEDYLKYVINLKGIKNKLNRKIFVSLFLLITDLGRVEKDLNRSLRLLNQTPILFIQGERDFINPPRNIYAAINILNSRKAELWIINNSNHLTGYFVAKEEYEKRIVGFYDRSMKNNTKESIMEFRANIE